MKYMGSKARYVKHILPIILEDRADRTYVEPFAGGCNVICNVEGPRLANDVNPYIIFLMMAASQGWQPPETVTEEEYQSVKLNPLGYSPEFVGFVSVGCSYSGKVWGGYARGNDSYGKPRNYARESRDNLLKQASGLKGIQFRIGDYRQLRMPENSVIYCDPPYSGTTDYSSGSFDSASFWEQCKSWSKDGHKVFCSEYSAPSGWECIWQAEVCSSLTKETGSKRAVERLFTL